MYIFNLLFFSIDTYNINKSRFLLQHIYQVYWTFFTVCACIRCRKADKKNVNYIKFVITHFSNNNLLPFCSIATNTIFEQLRIKQCGAFLRIIIYEALYRFKRLHFSRISVLYPTPSLCGHDKISTHWSPADIVSLVKQRHNKLYFFNIEPWIYNSAFSVKVTSIKFFVSNGKL